LVPLDRTRRDPRRLGQRLQCLPPATPSEPSETTPPRRIPGAGLAALRRILISPLTPLKDAECCFMRAATGRGHCTMPLEPLPETGRALAGLAGFVDRPFGADLVRRAEQVEEVVPNLVGLSVAAVREGLTFTLAATQEHIALLDAIQYVFGGPCVDAALEGATVLGGDNDEGLLSEQRWAEFARASAARGVMSTLSLPVQDAGQVVGSVNLYAATPNAFHGKEHQVAAIMGAWAPGAVHNADLSFSTREAARVAPQRMEDMRVLDEAAGIVMAAREVDEAHAREIIADAARQAGQDQLSVAREVIRPFLDDH
jgi:GAF domain-containing protein